MIVFLPIIWQNKLLCVPYCLENILIMLFVVVKVVTFLLHISSFTWQHELARSKWPFFMFILCSLWGSWTHGLLRYCIEFDHILDWKAPSGYCGGIQQCHQLGWHHLDDSYLGCLHGWCPSRSLLDVSDRMRDLSYGMPHAPYPVVLHPIVFRQLPCLSTCKLLQLLWDSFGSLVLQLVNQT